jgi:hypothetical protein
MAALPFALARLARQALPQRSDFIVLSLLARSISIPTRIMSAKEWLGFNTSRMERKWISIPAASNRW